jgi:ABC-type glycerol-3-phosphate transport system substrate-binding protein
MRKLVLLAVVLAAVYFGGVESGLIRGQQQHADTGPGGSEQALAAAFEKRQSDIQVQGSGRVSRILADDNKGSRHQRFIVQLASGQTVLVAHNIDLADRVASIKAGDPVEFNGEYEWNERGGVIHWTHRDPQGSHVGGWIKHGGRTYQ